MAGHADRRQGSRAPAGKRTPSRAVRAGYRRPGLSSSHCRRCKNQRDEKEIQTVHQGEPTVYTPQRLASAPKTRKAAAPPWRRDAALPPHQARHDKTLVQRQLQEPLEGRGVHGRPAGPAAERPPPQPRSAVPPPSTSSTDCDNATGLARPGCATASAAPVPANIDQSERWLTPHSLRYSIEPIGRAVAQRSRRRAVERVLRQRSGQAG